MFPALAGGFLTTVPPGKPSCICFYFYFLPLYSDWNIGYFCLHTQTEISTPSIGWSLGTFGLNYTIISPGSPAGQLQVWGLVQLHNRVSQFLIINLSLYIFVHPIDSVWRTLTNTPLIHFLSLWICLLGTFHKNGIMYLILYLTSFS